MLHGARPTRLIVNADDFGYFDQVSRGIVEAAARGIVTATGVMANGPALPNWIEPLKALPALSVGIHLNATLGQPLTSTMRRRLSFAGGQFPPKSTLVLSLLQGRMDADTLLDEWREQIRHCLAAGLTLHFVNSHEHVHMLPFLHARVRELAREFGITHVRAPRPEWGPRISFAGLVRSAAFSAVRALTPPAPNSEPLLIGVAPSGRLDSAYCRWRLARLCRGADYELMCHPGRTDPIARAHRSLNDYHDWEGEFATLVGEDFSRLLHEQQISLISYADLDR